MRKVRRALEKRKKLLFAESGVIAEEKKRCFRYLVPPRGQKKFRQGVAPSGGGRSFTYVPPFFHPWCFLNFGPQLRRRAFPEAATLRLEGPAYFLKFRAGLNPVFCDVLSGVVKSEFEMVQAKESAFMLPQRTQR